MRKLLIVFAVLFFVATVGPLPVAHADGIGQFRPTTNYPVVGIGYEADINDLVPTFNRYPFSTTDFYVPTRQEIDEALEAMEEASGRCIIPLNDYRDVQYGSECIQIINNVIWGTQLITAVLPPNYSPEPNKYPGVVAPNFYGTSNNFVLYGLRVNGKPYQAIRLARLAAAGAMVIVSNVGGPDSLGYHTAYASEMAALFDTLAAYWGVDKHRLIGFGGSRGAIVSLTLAENRLGSDYKFSDVFVSGLVGLRIGEQVSTSRVSNYPNVGAIMNVFAGNPQAFRDDAAKTFVLRGLFGSDDPAFADAVGVFANAWRLSGVSIHSSIGTGDSYINISEMVVFEKLLAGLGIPHRIDYVIGAGHSSAVDREVNKAVLKCVRNWPDNCLAPKDARFVYRVKGDDGIDKAKPEFLFSQEHDALLPFINAVLPYRLASGEASEAVLTGPAGAWFLVANSAGLSVQGYFGETGKVSIPFFTGDTDIAWQFQFVTPEGNMLKHIHSLVTRVGPVLSVQDYAIPGRPDLAFGFSLPLKKK